jgi:hypothetical protein
MGPRTGLDDLEKRKILRLRELELRPLGRPVVIPPALCRLACSFYEHKSESIRAY